jgi:transcription antitermination factor NusG
MPILAAEPSLYPAGLFDAPTDHLASSWWVLHTRPRQEKALARQLHDGAVGYYLPLLTKRTKIRGKLVPAHLPLFPGYLFLFADANQLLRALGTHRVARHLAVVDQDRLWQDLRQLHRLIETGLPVVPELALVPGARVEICSGPLAGLHGVIARSASGNRFIVEVDFIQRGASVLIEDHMLECIRE